MTLDQTIERLQELKSQKGISSKQLEVLIDTTTIPFTQYASKLFIKVKEITLSIDGKAIIINYYY